jgi:agmatine deiminase
VSRFEPVLVLAFPGFGREAEAACGPRVDVLELPLRGVWLRDAAPLFVRTEDGVAALDFGFNDWGESLPAAPSGSQGGAALAAALGMAHRTARLVLEGGAISCDGAGTLITMEPTVLAPNRNPGLTRAEAEAVFRAELGVERTVWLPHGLLEDRTGGHADNVAVFVAPGRVLCQVVRDADDPNHARLAANRDALDAAGLEVVELDLLPFRQWAGRRIALPYLNAYVGDGCAVVPLALAGEDDEALARLREVFPGREVVGVPATNLARRGGGPHCITQPVPR